MMTRKADTRSREPFRRIGTTTSRYLILKRLGEGSLGASYKARDLHLERIVALNLLPSRCLGREEGRRRLDRELAALAAFDHPNIRPVYDHGETAGGGRFIVAPYCDGETLAARIARGPLKLAVAIDLAVRIAAGLERAHERGILHGSLGPHCIIVADDGQPKILDFGAHALADQTWCDGTEAWRVDRGFKAPEQLRGEAADPRSDLWALGATLYQMVTGQCPAGLKTPVPVGVLRPEAAALDPILGRAMAPQRADRYADANEMQRALRTLSRSEAPGEASAGPAVARSVGPYRLLEHLGSGGMGIVYRAEDVRLGRTVALKLLPPERTRNPQAKARFLQEARMASALDHPNVCTVYDVGESEEGHLFLAMPYYEGETLRQRLQRGPLPVAEILDIVRQIAAGLAKAHQKGIVHRDIKPANLVITNERVVKILDFGIAKLKGESTITRAGSVIGTPAYMAPEQMRGEPVDARTDLWALGAVMYEMAAGRRPFPAESDVAVRAAILSGEVEPLARARPEAAELDRVLARLLAKNPEGRPASAEELAADLDRLARKPKGGSRLGLRLAAVLALTVAAGMGLYRGGFSPAKSTSIPERRPAVAVLGFRDLSGAAGARWLGPAMAEMLGTELAAGSKMRVISGDEVAHAQRTLSLPMVENPDAASRLRLYNLLGVDRAVVGSYLTLAGEGGRRIRLDLRVLHLPEGDTQAVFMEVGSEAELFDLVGRAGSDLRRQMEIGETSAHEEQEALALRPASLEATRFYTEGLTRLRSFDPAGARDVLSEAIRVEPGSAVIHSALSKAWSDLGYDSRAVEEAGKALKLSGPLPREQRLAIEARFHAAGNAWRKASDIYRSLWAFYPDNFEYGLSLAESLSRAGRVPDATATIAALRRLPGRASSDPRIDLQEALNVRDASDRATLERAVKAAEVKARASGESLVLGRALLLDGSIPLYHGRPTDGLPQFQEAQETYARAGDQSGMAEAMAWQCMALQRNGDFSLAEAACQEATVVFRRIGKRTGVMFGLALFVELYRRWGDLRKARTYLEQEQVMLDEVDDTWEKAYFLYNRSVLDLSEGNLRSAQKLLEEAEGESRQDGDRDNEARSLAALGTILALHGNLTDARATQNKALMILQGIQETTYKAPVLADSAEILARLGDLPGARRRIVQGLTEMREGGPRLGEAVMLRAAARVSLQAGDLLEARKYSQEHLRIARSTGSRTLIADALQNLGHVMLAENDPASARAALEEALHELEAGGDVFGQMSARMELALLLLAQNEPAGAVPLAREVAAWCQARGLEGEEARALSALAEGLLEQKHIPEALRAANQAKQQMEMSEDRPLRLEIAIRLARVDSEAGKMAKAIGSLEQASREALRTGFIPASWEARLALGKAQQESGALAEAAATLRTVRREASERGFKRISGKAATLLDSTPRRRLPRGGGEARSFVAG
jgi:serine/threonine protein kinase/tetratricopeptide (TPR) repeat protein